MDTREPEAHDDRASNGQFRPGWKGGPGNPNVRRMAELQAAVRDAVEPDVLHGIIRKLSIKALEGDVTAARVLLERVCGKPRTEQSVYSFELPPIESASDLPAAFDRLTKAASAGEVTVDDAARFASILELARRAIETSELADRVEQLEDHIGGGRLRA